METFTIAQKKSQIFETKNRAESILSEEEQINSFLDKIISAQKNFNKLNNIYLELIQHIDEVSHFNKLDNDGASDLKEIIDTLYTTNISASKLFSDANNNETLRNGCKNVLLDFRVNIRNLRESLGDLEELFFLKEEDSELDNLLEEFAI